MGYTSLEDFESVSKIAEVLDDYFHVNMHVAVGDADSGTTGEFYCSDVANPLCAVRDPMFWRLHKALDEVIRSWQDHLAVDVVVVIDRSGSMGSTASGTPDTKLEMAVDSGEQCTPCSPTAAGMPVLATRRDARSPVTTGMPSS